MDNSPRDTCFCGGSLAPVEDCLGTPVRRCRKCGYMVSLVDYSREELLAVYAGESHETTFQGQTDGSDTRFGALISRLRGVFARDRVQRALGRLPKGHRNVLDFGCGQGFLLDAVSHLRERGVGIEICEESARTARAKGHEVNLDLVSLSAHAPRADMVFSVHVLEHIPDIERVLANLHSRLADTARFHFEVPNFGSLQARLFNCCWLHTEAGLHIHHFTRDAFLSLLQRNGYDVESFTYRSFEQGVAGWLQSLYNMFFPYNRFFRAWILNRPLRDKLRAWPELLLAPLALTLSVLLYLAETRILGKGPVLLAEGRIAKRPR